MANKQTILVVDDEQDLLDLIEYNLKKEDFDVLKAEDGKEGIQMAREHSPDLILLDIMMPKMDGLEAVEVIRDDEELKHIPVIFLTARGDEKTEVEGLDKGGDDYITKPISTTKLISRIKAVMRRFEETEEPNRIEVHDLAIDKDRYIVTLVRVTMPRSFSCHAKNLSCSIFWPAAKAKLWIVKRCSIMFGAIMSMLLIERLTCTCAKFAKSWVMNISKP